MIVCYFIETDDRDHNSFNLDAALRKNGFAFYDATFASRLHRAGAAIQLNNLFDIEAILEDK